MFLTDKIKNDLTESRINWKVVLIMIPVAFLTYLFHEFGHWIVGELLGNKMLYSLNNVTPLSGSYIHNSDNLLVRMGGPAFTILQAIIFLIVIEKTKSIYVYPVVFFAGFARFFSIILGGFNKQDEAYISAMLNIGAYTFAAIVLLILFIIVWRSSAILKLNLKAVGYFTVLGVISILIVIATVKLIS
ncbi:MAG: hypothetical protein IPH11_09000 [Ignavibacteriales bacterium]|nr:hypothetical protein [Ignavibacteriales bacterium]